MQPGAAGQAEEQWGGKIKGAARVSAAQDGSLNRAPAGAAGSGLTSAAAGRDEQPAQSLT